MQKRGYAGIKALEAEILQNKPGKFLCLSAGNQISSCISMVRMASNLALSTSKSATASMICR